MKKYTIHYNFCATADVEVLAESEEEAREKAREVDLELKDYFFDMNEETVLDEEEIPDLQDMTDKAGQIIKKFNEDEPEDFFKVEEYPTVTIPSWDGTEYVNNHYVVEDFYWDYKFSELGMTTDGPDVLLWDLPEIERYNIVSLIIREASRNGIN